MEFSGYILWNYYSEYLKHFDYMASLLLSYITFSIFAVMQQMPSLQKVLNCLKVSYITSNNNRPNGRQRYNIIGKYIHSFFR